MYSLRRGTSGAKPRSSRTPNCATTCDRRANMDVSRRRTPPAVVHPTGQPASLRATVRFRRNPAFITRYVDGHPSPRMRSSSRASQRPPHHGPSDRVIVAVGPRPTALLRRTASAFGRHVLPPATPVAHADASALRAQALKRRCVRCAIASLFTPCSCRYAVAESPDRRRRRRYFSFRETGLSAPRHQTAAAHDTSLGHHAERFSGALRSSQASSLRSDPFGARGLDSSSRAPRMGNCVMAGTH